MKMQNYFIALTLVIFTSCSSVPILEPQSPTPTPIFATLSPTLPPTQTLILEATSIPEMSTLNPSLAQVLTSTPDFQSLPTRTVSPPEKCPDPDTSVRPGMPQNIYEASPDFSYTQAILEYLNMGGSSQSLKVHFDLSSRYWAEKDLTGDSVSELIIITRGLDIFMCKNGQFIHAYHIYPYDSPGIVAIEDMNLDGISELVTQGEIFSASTRIYKIFEWNGIEFQSLVWAQEDLLAWFDTTKGKSLTWYGAGLAAEPEIDGIEGEAEIKDIDHDGTLEFIVHNGIFPVRLRSYVPDRPTTDIYKWNGVLFLWDQVEMSRPVFRFQAAQDADRMSFMGEYQKAVDLYMEVIQNDNLLAWSPENYQKQLEAEGQGLPTPTPIPLIQEEYDNLAAYAYYRIMLLNVIQNDAASAENKLTQLQQKFTKGQPSYLYVDMATIFWQSYQSSQSIGNACLDVIKFAADHEDELFVSLGNPVLQIYFRPQGHEYTPWDMCPFE